MNSLRTRAMLSLSALLLATACGGGDDTKKTDGSPPIKGSDGTNTKTDGGGGGGLGGSCCLNKQFYQCDTKEAFDLCAGFDVGACHAACGADFQCHMDCDDKAINAKHDPSQCTRRSERDGECKMTGICSGSTNGMKCSYSHQCPGGHHCTNKKCYKNEVGNPCDYSHQCVSKNCTNKCCQARTKGSPCSYSHQCDSGNCTDGECQ